MTAFNNLLETTDVLWVTKRNAHMVLARAGNLCTKTADELDD